MTSQYQPPLPALRIVPQPSVARNRSRGTRSFCETLKAAESFQLRVVAARATHDMKLASPNANPDRNAPSECGIAATERLSC